MTFTEEFEDRELEEFDEYPIAFGITFTPRNGWHFKTFVDNALRGIVPLSDSKLITDN